MEEGATGALLVIPPFFSIENDTLLPPMLTRPLFCAEERPRPPAPAPALVLVLALAPTTPEALLSIPVEEPSMTSRNIFPTPLTVLPIVNHLRLDGILRT